MQMGFVQENIDLLNFNTFHVSAKARFFIEINDAIGATDLLKSALLSEYPHFVLGGGSNILFTNDFNGVIIHPVIRGIEVLEEKNGLVRIRTGAGEDWDGFVEYCVNNEFGGIENLSWIPGLVGASPVQNIGAYGTEIMEYIDFVEGHFLDTGKSFSIAADDCEFSYRNSIFKNELKNRILITHVVFKLHREPRFNTTYPDVKKEMKHFSEISLKSIRQAIIRIRKRKLPDPSETGNAGSFFKNPVVRVEMAEELKEVYSDVPVYSMNEGYVKLSAAWLIEKSGWKGKSTGNAGTHSNQPLIIINHGGASGMEILNFAHNLQKSVFEHFGIRLEMEVNIL
jgi:UDP-N-acetylmuramate dehydrogenase